MMRRRIGLVSLCLGLFAAGCSSSPVTEPGPQVVTPEVPAMMLRPLPAPSVEVSHNRDLLQLLADYEALRQRFNADRVGIAKILQRPGEGD